MKEWEFFSQNVIYKVDIGDCFIEEKFKGNPLSSSRANKDITFHPKDVTKIKLSRTLNQRKGSKVVRKLIHPRTSDWLEMKPKLVISTHFAEFGRHYPGDIIVYKRAE